MEILLEFIEKILSSIRIFQVVHIKWRRKKSWKLMTVIRGGSHQQPPRYLHIVVVIQFIQVFFLWIIITTHLVLTQFDPFFSTTSAHCTSKTFCSFKISNLLLKERTKRYIRIYKNYRLKKKKFSIMIKWHIQDSASPQKMYCHKTNIRCK